MTAVTASRTPSDELAPKRVRRGAASRNDGAWPWLFVLPLLTGVGLFFIWPIIQTAYFSFTKWGVFGGSTFIGVENYARLFTDPRLYSSLGNTLIYTVVVLLGIPIAVFLASLLNTPGLRFASFYRVLFFLPYVAMPTAVAIVWRIIFNGDFGVLNYALSLVGIDGPYWISTPGTAIFAVAIVGLWSSLGFSMIILASGLKNIPPELYDCNFEYFETPQITSVFSDDAVITAIIDIGIGFANERFRCRELETRFHAFWAMDLPPRHPQPGDCPIGKKLPKHRNNRGTE